MKRTLLYDRHTRSGLAGKLLKIAGTKPVDAEHTREEGLLLQKCAQDRGVLVELGVAEGASAYEMRQAMSAAGRLFLIDPYAGARIPWLRSQEIVARSLLGSVPRGRVVFIRDFGENVVKQWRDPIDLVFIDADHRYASVKADWNGWAPHVVADGLVAMHDARICPKRQIGPDDGPVRLCAELRLSNDWAVLAEVDSLVVFKRANNPTEF